MSVNNAQGRRVQVVDAQDPASLARALHPEAAFQAEPLETTPLPLSGETLPAFLLRYYVAAGLPPSAARFERFAEEFLARLPLAGLSSHQGIPALALTSGHLVPFYRTPYEQGSRAAAAYAPVTPESPARRTPGGVEQMGQDQSYGAITGPPGTPGTP